MQTQLANLDTSADQAYHFGSVQAEDLAKMKAQLNDAKLDEKILVRQEAIIMSMTPKERRNPEIIKASRKKRIAAGSGSSVQDVNKLLKQHQDMAKMMKQVGKLGKKGMMRGGLQNLLPRM